MLAHVGQHWLLCDFVCVYAGDSTISSSCYWLRLSGWHQSLDGCLRYHYRQLLGRHVDSAPIHMRLPQVASCDHISTLAARTKRQEGSIEREVSLKMSVPR